MRISTPSLLPETLDTSAATALHAMLLDRLDRGEALHLDGGEVMRAGLACIQVLASARVTAAARGVDFRLDSRSEALSRMIALAGLGDALVGDAAKDER